MNPHRAKVFGTDLEENRRFMMMGRVVSSVLEDGHGREVSQVRVSLTDRCNFDCVYCHNEGLGDTRGPMDPQDHEMDADDVVRFLEVARGLDADSVKFPDGEPLFRQYVEEISSLGVL